MSCKECENQPSCTSPCEELQRNLSGTGTPNSDLLHRRHRMQSFETVRDDTLDMQAANDALIVLENLGILPIDHVTQLPPCLRLKELRKLGYDI